MAPTHLADRLAVAAWRLGLGPVAGRRYALLTTLTGERSLRRTVHRYEFTAGNIYLLGGDGTEPWYQDLAETPRATVQVALGPRSMRAHRISVAEEIRAVYGLYALRSPRHLDRNLRRRDLPLDSEAVISDSERIHWLAFEPTSEQAPPMVPPDLAWAWAISAVLLFWLRRRRVGS